ncbi:hypothetical protein Ppa06_64740 [Planomonospora parontospora subsp. parontospora]|uniref:Uncharacterized protein n=2 Tax=Planomonospora parontospora TaxID=58119 RepID=A0AA37BMV8_9ACTN|nr:hypothetical protein [Planomonospora parontospora]GGK94328.1 hypothetical protein GCM10010126_62200 [Planomonospora parontospora]GII12676.1 hypothetical protein Ppa06_64740 [Planomonospora parontospora subsp. parontospora]
MSAPLTPAVGDDAAAIAALHARLATATAEEVLELARTCPVPGVRTGARRITTALHRLREQLAAVVAEACRQAEADVASVESAGPQPTQRVKAAGGNASGSAVGNVVGNAAGNAGEPAGVNDSDKASITASGNAGEPAGTHASREEVGEAPLPVRPAPARRRRRSAPSAPRKPRTRTATGPAARRSGNASGLSADTIGDRGWTFTIHPVTETEAAAVRRLCTRYGSTPDETAELIDMLGISAQEAIAR